MDLPVLTSKKAKRVRDRNLLLELQQLLPGLLRQPLMGDLRAPMKVLKRGLDRLRHQDQRRHRS